MQPSGSNYWPWQQTLTAQHTSAPALKPTSTHATTHASIPDSTAVTAAFSAVATSLGNSETNSLSSLSICSCGQHKTCPTFSPPARSYFAETPVTITSATSGAIIRYTTDGSTPSGSSTLYSGAISVAGNGTNKTIKAIGIKSGMLDSTVWR